MRRTAFAVVALVAVGCIDKKTTSGTAAKVWAREAFSAAVVGKTQDEVIAAMGKPDKTTETSGQPKLSMWYYYDRTIDPVSGKADASAQLIFENDRVVRVNY